jgi:hypothetical protein
MTPHSRSGQKIQSKNQIREAEKNTLGNKLSQNQIEKLRTLTPLQTFCHKPTIIPLKQNLPRNQEQLLPATSIHRTKRLQKPNSK